MPVSGAVEAMLIGLMLLGMLAGLVAAGVVVLAGQGLLIAVLVYSLVGSATVAVLAAIRECDRRPSLRARSG